MVINNEETLKVIDQNLSLASIGDTTSQIISKPTSSEDELYRRDNSDYEQGAVEEEEGGEEETDYETDN